MSVSNDCTGDAWLFNWSDVAGASRYHMSLTGPGNLGVVIDEQDLATSTHRWPLRSFVEGNLRQGWRWKVRAMVEGSWKDWSAENTFNVDSLAPVLTYPEPTTVMDNGCSDGTDAIEWNFTWSECRHASNYHLYVIGPSATIAVVDESRLTRNEFSSRRFGSNIVEPNRRGWQWKVRARIDGTWREWTPGTFDVEPLNTDCGGS